MSSDRPGLSCLPDGPYLLKNESEVQVSLCRQTADGESTETVTGAALCRCGASANKPFCDGTHRRNGFSDKKISDGSQDRRDSYTGEGITIHDNRGICAHAGVCTDNLKSVFRMGQEPWIDPDGAAVDDIIDLIGKCPSGALSYSLQGQEAAATDSAPTITVIKDGPYAVSGIDLIDQAPGEGASALRYTLCRCGASKNKPYCDGSHWDAGFKDEG